MNVKQLTYTALSSGWGNERIIGSPSERERTEFNRVSGQSRTDAVLYAYNFSNGVGMLYRSVPYGTDVLGRARFYSHGYVFSGTDCDEMFKDYSRFLGIVSFAEGEGATLREFEELTTSFHRKVDVNLKLIEAVYEALFNDRSIEIRFSGDNNELFIRALMNTIFAFVPLQLRKFLSFSSAPYGTVRKVTLSNKPCDFTDITYYPETGEVSGLRGLYRDFVAALATDKRETYLKTLEDRMGVRFFNDIKTILEDIKVAIGDIVFEANAYNPVADDQIVPLFEKAVLREQFSNPADVKCLTNIFSSLIEHKSFLSDSFDDEVALIFSETDSDELKRLIAHYFMLTGALDKDSGFERILYLKNYNRSLCAYIMQAFIKAKNATFLSACAKQALNDTSFALFLQEICTNDYADIICKELVNYIVANRRDTELLSKLFDSPFHSRVVARLLSETALKAIMWDYVCLAYSTPDNLRKYAELDRSSLNACEEFFFKELSVRGDDAINLLKNIYSNFDTDTCNKIEIELLKHGCAELVESFCINAQTLCHTSCKDFERRKLLLEKSGISSARYVASVAELYAVTVVEENKNTQHSENHILDKIRAFALDVDIDKLSPVRRIKEDFWNEFSFKGFHPSSTIRKMALSDNEKSAIANALFSLAEYVSGKTDVIGSDEYRLCKKILCHPSKLLSVKGRENLLKRFIAMTPKSLLLDIELFLLLFYSPKKNSVALDERRFTVLDLCRFVTDNARNEDSIIHLSAVAKSIYDYLSNLPKKLLGRDKNSYYEKALSVLRFIVQKNSLSARFKRSVKKHFYSWFYSYTAFFTALICVVARCIWENSLLAPFLSFFLSISGSLVLANLYEAKKVPALKLFSACALVAMYMLLTYLL